MYFQQRLDDLCHLIDQEALVNQVETTPSTVHDVKVTSTIQLDLARRGLQPAIQLVDQGYIEIDRLVESRKKGIELIGPVPTSKSWQDRKAGAFNHTEFLINWDNRQVTCPNGKISIRCTDRKTWRGTPSLTFVFNKEDYFVCPLRERCSKAKNVSRTLMLYPQEQYNA